jgi:hypothetical protein
MVRRPTKEAPMNRIYGVALSREPLPLPKPEGPFTDAEAVVLLMAYRKCPGDLACPKCGPGTVEVLSFIEPAIDAQGYATVKWPEGEYAAAVMCHGCKRAIGLLAGLN